MSDRVPADVLELVARRRLAEHIAAIAEKEPGVEAPERVGRCDRPADVGEDVQRRHQAAPEIGLLDRPCRRFAWRRGGHPPDQYPRLFPGLAQGGAGGAGEPGAQRLCPGFDTPGDPVRRIYRATGEDVDAGHEFDIERAAAGQHLECPSLAAQQDQGGGVARTSDHGMPATRCCLLALAAWPATPHIGHQYDIINYQTILHDNYATITASR